MSVATPTTSLAPGTRSERLSVPRVLVVVLAGFVLFAGAGLGLYGFVRLIRTPVVATPVKTKTWFAPYVDVTLPPTYNFQDVLANPAEDAVLGFVVGGGTSGCTPEWGGEYTMAQAALKLDLDRRIVRLRQGGGNVMVSFGGAVNNELAVSCRTTAALAAAYSSVISRYSVTSVDFDLEGTSLTNIAAGTRRAAALAAIQTGDRSTGHDLSVWVTLPVTPQGLLSSATTAIAQLLNAHVQLAGINLLTMNYGGSRPSNLSMVDASMDALTTSAKQIDQIYVAHGDHLTTTQLHTLMGVTPMIGQNSVLTDKFPVDQATQFYNRALAYGVGRFSMWSLNRDSPCGGNADQAIASNWCSGVLQTSLEFSHIFASDTVRLPRGSLPREQTLLGWSNSATLGAAPYDEWRQLREYVAGARVVWDGEVYESKWWNVGQVPNAVVTYAWDSPWMDVGPVLPDEATTTTLPPGVAPAWVSTAQYGYGQRVERKGVLYTAQWQNQGYDPASDPDNTWQNPWMPVSPPPGSDYPSSN